jgi:peptidoglycan/xylan/chitin deacetylase (PgdA/CDA1 family)
VTDSALLRVALTFDAEHPDRPNVAGTAERLLDALDTAGVPATFFVQGRWAEAYPATARAIATAGHQVGNHSHYHARMPLLTDSGLAEDIAEAGRIILDTTGVDPLPWFRCPFGAGATDPRVQAVVTAAGYRHVGWHIAAEDWEPSRTGGAIEADLVAGVRDHGDGAVILLHTWPSGTLAAIPGTIARLRDRGAAFVRVDALESIPVAPSWA